MVLRALTLQWALSRGGRCEIFVPQSHLCQLPMLYSSHGREYHEGGPSYIQAVRRRPSQLRPCSYLDEHGPESDFATWLWVRYIR